jgi:hypothetical protein
VSRVSVSPCLLLSRQSKQPQVKSRYRRILDIPEVGSVFWGARSLNHSGSNYSIWIERGLPGGRTAAWFFLITA